jgi:hypothetical protein
MREGAMQPQQDPIVEGAQEYFRNGVVLRFCLGAQPAAFELLLRRDHPDADEAHDVRGEALDCAAIQRSAGLEGPFGESAQ